MLCYAMLCYALYATPHGHNAMPCYRNMLCYAMARYAILCSEQLCYAMLCYCYPAMVSFATLLCYATLVIVLCYPELVDAMLYDVGCNAIYLCRAHAMLCYAMLCYNTSHAMLPMVVCYSALPHACGMRLLFCNLIDHAAAELLL